MEEDKPQVMEQELPVCDEIWDIDTMEPKEKHTKKYHAIFGYKKCEILLESDEPFQPCVDFLALLPLVSFLSRRIRQLEKKINDLDECTLKGSSK